MKDKLDIHLALAILLFTMLLVVLLVVSFHEIPLGNKDAFTMLLGAILTFVGAVVGYYYGTSKQSAAKDATIAALSEKP
jgi:drug/metabolite transporter (DMT)-like permease